MVRAVICLGAAIAALAISGPSAVQRVPGRSNSGQSIVGRVTGSAGHPLRGVYVTVLRDQDERGAPRLHPVNVRLNSITNETGDYRLENLSPDNYAVVAFPNNTPRTPQNQPNRSGYGITYYPSAAHAAEAKSVLVTPNAGATANITLVPARLSVVSGSVTASDGKQASAARLVIAHGDGLFGLATGSATVRSDGSFALAGLPPGTYFLHMREGLWPPPLDVIPKVSVAKVVVVDRDVTGVRVDPLPMVRATGRVLVDPAVRDTMNPSTIRVSAVPVDFDGNPGPNRAGTLRDDLTFEFRTWPALGYVRVLPESQWIVARVRLNGVDVTNSGIDFRAGRDITGLEIELTKGPTR